MVRRSSVTFGAGLHTIEAAAFRSTALTSIALPDSLAAIGNEAFQDSASLTSATFGSGLQTIHSRAFAGTIGFNLQAQFISYVLFSGILNRFPDLQFVVAESGVGWVPYVLEMCDHEWERCNLSEHGHPVRPSELFKGHGYVDFWYEQKGLAYHHVIGSDRIMWESDFPHPTSIWPNSSRYIEGSLGHVTQQEREMILAGNAKRVYRL